MDSLENEAFAICRFRYDKAMIADYYHCIILTLPQFVTMCVIAAAALVYGLISTIMQSSPVFIITAFVMFAAMFLFIFVYYKKTVKRSTARFLDKQSANDCDNVVYVTPDRVVVRECDGRQHSIAYGEFIRLQESKTLYLLATADKRFVFLAKDGFIKGDAAKIIEFISQNYPKIRRRISHATDADSGEIE